MKLFVIAALVAVAAAGRLEHLERSYLPPDSNSISSGRSLGSHGGFGSSGSHGAFGASSGNFGAGARQQGAFAGATSNQYLPPNHGPSGSNGAPQFAGSLQGFGGAQNYRSQQNGGHQGASAQQYSAPSSQYGAPSSQYSAPSSQYSAPSSQYSAPSSQYSAPSSQYSAPSSQYSAPRSQYSAAPSSQYGAPAGSFGQSATSRQYLAPRASSSQQYPQQAFDEQTGYQY
ncbi:pro-resilin-like [Helicoverpa armigera]|uniref:pro-resilin-like n=1 Tax=Helicoverpa armigera TaxID=29058 RepID=UPI0030829468